MGFHGMEEERKEQEGFFKLIWGVVHKQTGVDSVLGSLFTVWKGRRPTPSPRLSLCASIHFAWQHRQHMHRRGGTCPPPPKK